MPLLALAGCAGDAPPVPSSSAAATDADPGAGGATFDFEAGIPVPLWSVGDWWQYRVEFNSGETYDSKTVVYAEDGSSYYVTSEDRELLLRSGITHYPTFGPVTKSRLNQLIHGVEVGFLRFPMMNASWEAPYRDFTGVYHSGFAQLATAKGPVPGFFTVMHHGGDGLFRMSNGWSPIPKWFTNFTFDFDGIPPLDVTITLQDWGTNYTGTLPVVELVEGVHRPFPTVVVGPPDPASPPNPSQAPAATATFMKRDGGTSMLVSMFAGAGGAGSFEYRLTSAASPATGFEYAWRPTSAGSHFEWHEVTAAPAGEWRVTGGGSAQASAFLFLEAYEVMDAGVTLPA